MTRLGYERFGVQGGDIGAAVSPEVGRVAPDRVVGVHVNGGAGSFPQLPLSDADMASLTELERDRIARIEAFMNEEFGYIAVQSARPRDQRAVGGAICQCWLSAPAISGSTVIGIRLARKISRISLTCSRLRMS